MSSPRPSCRASGLAASSKEHAPGEDIRAALSTSSERGLAVGSVLPSEEAAKESTPSQAGAGSSKQMSLDDKVVYKERMQRSESLYSRMTSNCLYYIS